MGDMWKADEDIHRMMRDLVASHHPDLALVVDEILVVFTEKGGKSTVPGSASRVSDTTNLVGGTKYKFMITLPADKWEHELGAKEREILLNHHLFSCRVDDDPNSADLKCYIVKPDVVAFSENVEIYGPRAMFAPKDEEPPQKSGPISDEES